MVSASWVEVLYNNRSGDVFLSTGGWKKFDRGSGACTGQSEGGDADAVFIVEAGGTLQNVIIGKNQAEGVHCKGGTYLLAKTARGASAYRHVLQRARSTMCGSKTSARMRSPSRAIVSIYVISIQVARG
jgi:hypothetical protein